MGAGLQWSEVLQTQQGNSNHACGLYADVRKGEKRTEKTTPVGVNVTISLVIYQAAQTWKGYSLVNNATTLIFRCGS